MSKVLNLTVAMILVALLVLHVLANNDTGPVTFPPVLEE
ncbi:unnamed protein product [Tenebrio molitor]|nr:unnamed protein product [Tenebrio molitor]